MAAMFFGWRMVALAFLTNFISVGFVFYSYGVFFKALASDFGGSRLGVSLGLTCMNVVSSLLSPKVGGWLDAGRIKRTMIVGAGLMGVGFVLASAITELWHFYLVIALVMGPGVCMLGVLPSTTLVANWFVDRRGAALGLATMGVSLSGVLMPPLATGLIAQIGWRGTFLVYAATAGILVIPAVARWIVQRPEDVGQRPDGRTSLAPAEQALPNTAWSHLLRERNFWLTATVVGFNFCAMGALLTHAVPHATDIGFSPAAAALLLSVMAGAGALGKPIFGGITDRLDKRAVIWLVSGMQLVGLLLLLDAADYLSLLVAGAAFGFGMGGVVPLHGALIGAAFGRQAFGRVMGLMTPFMLPLTSLGVPYAGYIFDRDHSYGFAFQSFAGLYLVAMVAAFFLRLPSNRLGDLPDAALSTHP
ncbi:MAG: MFS transporter [Myxococcales bacterium]|nr:MFS transporter [Myxococcales bacterium]